ncbi:MAG: hypothetical protein H7Y32_09895, partial [Chloroflexales bacterium]|nr:hypothetical protein [Chloroflexales bacterium]
ATFGASTPLTSQTWQIQLQAAYAPTAPVPQLPELCAALAQPPAQLWADTGQAQQLAEATLVYGQELVVRTRAAGAQPPLSELWITPPDSLP